MLLLKYVIMKGYAAIDDFLFLPSEGSPSDDQCTVLPEVKIIIIIIIITMVEEINLNGKIQHGNFVSSFVILSGAIIAIHSTLTLSLFVFRHINQIIPDLGDSSGAPF